MELTPAHAGPALILSPAGRIDHASAAAFEAALAPHLDACQVGGTPIVLDMAGVDYISSVGLRVLMLAARKVAAQEGRIVVAGLTPLVAEVFTISRFNLVFKVYADRAAALDALT